MSIGSFLRRCSRKIDQIRFYQNPFSHIGMSCGIGKDVSVRGAAFISIGTNVAFGDRCSIQAWPEYRGAATGLIPELKIGNNVSLMADCHISCMRHISIGDGCLLGNNVFITDNFHGSNSTKEELDIPPITRSLCSKGPVKIGKNVWIGRNVCIMPDVEIGDGVVIGANSVVTKSIPSYSVAAGVPASILRRLES